MRTVPLAPRCRNGGCASTRVNLYRIEGLPEPRYLCRECAWNLRGLYVLAPLDGVDRRGA